MNLSEFRALIKKTKKKKEYFLPINFGCRVNSAEINQLSQILVDEGYSPTTKKNSESPDIIIINTCSITQKGEYESLSQIRRTRKKYPKSKLFVTGCADLLKVEKDKHIFIFSNKSKEKILKDNACVYSKKVLDKFSNSDKYLLKVQSGCKQFCTYCTVPYNRNYSYSINPVDAISTINMAIKDGYREVILTGVNLDEYKHTFSKLLEKILTQTSIEKISFGSIPINCIDANFLSLYNNNKYSNRLSKYLHIPIQSGSDTILKLMNRPYTRKTALRKFKLLSRIDSTIKFGTDIIVGFPGETDKDFKLTTTFCQKIGFTRIHTFRFSRRKLTLANYFYEKYPKLNPSVIDDRAATIRAIFQTTLPSHQKPSF